MTWVTLIKFKHDGFVEFQKFKVKAEKQSGQKLKVLRTDGGGEYNSTEFRKFCEENGIEHEVIVPYTPQYDGLTERRNWTFLNMTRSMLKEKKLSHTLCSTKKLKEIVPFENWAGDKQSVSHFMVFGFVCYKHVPGATRKKWDDRSKVMLLIGYHNTVLTSELTSQEISDSEGDSASEDQSESDGNSESKDESESDINFEVVKDPEGEYDDDLYSDDTPESSDNPTSDNGHAFEGGPFKGGASEGMKILYSEKGIILHQLKYELELLKRFKLKNYKTAITPAETNHKVDSDIEGDNVDVRIFKQLADSLRYLCNIKPDICYTVEIDLKIKVKKPVKLMIDNKSAISLTKNSVLHERNNYINTKFHFLRNRVQN
ncbi:uncharacterized protein LOC127093655 [Lathyrus oleraceus]|uniref:uncharacterized protein LOC127093655 n=1 Tax=Pisum sativum TaxID=3888 RepID=UPI0021D13CFA|nr:uncharacterized protein LOC127093655 [Pisum sativum]